MQENQPNSITNFRFFSFSKYTIALLTVIGISFIIRFYFFPTQVPLNLDALYYFWYSSDIHQIGGLPNDWSPLNNGWPIFVSLFFSVFDIEDMYRRFTLLDFGVAGEVVMTGLAMVEMAAWDCIGKLTNQPCRRTSRTARRRSQPAGNSDRPSGMRSRGRLHAFDPESSFGTSRRDRRRRASCC